MFSMANINPQATQIQNNLHSLGRSESHALTQGLLPMPNVVHNDPILKVFEQMEEGSTARYLEHSWKQPSVTWLGKFFDKYMWGAGEYSKQEPVSSEKNSNALSNPAQPKQKRNMCDFDFMLQKDREKLYPQDFNPSAMDEFKDVVTRVFSFVKCSMKINQLITGNACTALPNLSKRKSYCPPIAENEVICLPLAVSEEKGEKPYCLPKNPRTLYVHIILKDTVEPKIFDLYNVAFARYHQFCANNCLTCDSLAGDCNLAYFSEKYEGEHKFPDLATRNPKFNVTVVSPEGNMTRWDRFQLLHFVDSFFSRCEGYKDTELSNEKIFKALGYTMMVIGVAGVGLFVFKSLNNCFINRGKVELKKDDRENELSQVSSN